MGWRECGWAAGVVLLVGVSACAGGVSVMGVGDLGGWAPTVVIGGISDDGSVVAGVGNTGSGFQWFRWTQSGGIQGTYSNYYPVTGSVTGLSGDGSTIVGYRVRSAEVMLAMRWTEAGGVTDLTSSTGEALGVSRDGNVVVGWYQPGDLGTQVAFRWTAAGGMATIPLGLPAGVSSMAEACSADGSVVVGVTSGSYPFRWSADQGMTRLTPGQGDALGISGDGKVVVGYVGGTGPNDHQAAFRWSTADGLEEIGEVPGSTADMEGVAASWDGSVVVGHSGSLFDVQDGWVWTDDEGSRSMREIMEEGGMDTSEWKVIVPMDVSADGQTVAVDVQGWLKNSPMVGLVVTIPEPGGVVGVMVGLVGVAGGRRREGCGKGGVWRR